MKQISSCIPAEIALRQHEADEEFAELDGREYERRVEEELAWLIRFPGDYCVKADDDVFAQLVHILTDGYDDTVGRCRDVLDKDMRRVAEEACVRIRP